MFYIGLISLRNLEFQQFSAYLVSKPVKSNMSDELHSAKYHKSNGEKTSNIRYSGER